MKTSETLLDKSISTMSGPVKHASKTSLSTPDTLASDSLAILVSDISGISTNAGDCSSLTISDDVGAGTGKVLAFKGPLFTSVTGKLHAWCVGSDEGTTIGRDAKKDLVWRNVVWWTSEVFNGRIAGWSIWLRGMRV